MPNQSKARRWRACKYHTTQGHICTLGTRCRFNHNFPENIYVYRHFSCRLCSNAGPCLAHMRQHVWTARPFKKTHCISVKCSLTTRHLYRCNGFIMPRLCALCNCTIIDEAAKNAFTVMARMYISKRMRMYTCATLKENIKAAGLFNLIMEYLCFADYVESYIQHDSNIVISF